MENCNPSWAQFFKADTNSMEKHYKRTNMTSMQYYLSWRAVGSRDTQLTAGRNSQFSSRTSNEVVELQQGESDHTAQNSKAFQDENKLHGEVVVSPSIRSLWEQTADKCNQCCLHWPGEGEMIEIREWNSKLRSYSTDRFWNITFRPGMKQEDSF